MKATATVVAFLSLLASGLASADPRPYGSLSAAEQATCDEYATQAERFARGREAGFSVLSPLQAARDVCTAQPDSDKACKGFPALARIVHREQWTAAGAGAKVRSDCLRWIYP